MVGESLNFIKANLVSISICSVYNEETPNTSEATIVIRRCALLTRRISCGLLMLVIGGGRGGGGGGGGAFSINRRVMMIRFQMEKFV